MSYQRIPDPSTYNHGHSSSNGKLASDKAELYLAVPTKDETEQSARGDRHPPQHQSDSSWDAKSFSSFTITTISGKATSSDITDSITEVDLNTPDEERKPVRQCCGRLRGIFAILFATCLISLNNQILFYVFDILDVPFSKSLFLSWSYSIYSVINVVPMLFSMFYYGPDVICQPFKLNAKLKYLIIVRGLLGSLIQFVTSHAIDRFEKPAPVSVITAMAPIFVYINAYFVLKEKLGLIPILNVFVAVGGVVVMNINDLEHPQNGSKALIATSLALAAMYLLSWITVIVRFLRVVNPWLVNLAFGVGGMVVQGIIVLCENNRYIIDDPTVFGMCVASAVVTAMGNYFYNISLHYESAGVVSLLRTTEVVYSFMFQFCFFGIQVDMFTGIGGAMILFGVVCVTFRKIVDESEETSVLRKYLWFLLY